MTECEAYVCQNRENTHFLTEVSHTPPPNISLAKLTEPTKTISFLVFFLVIGVAS